MQIKFSDGVELEALGVHGRNIYYQGVSRDCLIFLFDPETVSPEKIRARFTSENSTAITVIDENGTYIHENYTIRIETGEGYVSHILDEAIGQDLRQCVFVKMAQSTLAERKILEQQAAIDALVVAALEG